MITQVSIATLPVRDQDKTLDFFVGKLGFELRTDAPYGPDARWIEVAPPGSATGVNLSKVDDDAAYQQRLAGIVLGCDDAAATAERLRAAGCEVTDPDSQAWGTFILVTEPDGRQICITQTDTTG